MADDAPAAPQQLTETGFGVPHSARVRNHWLGGRESHGTDRAAAERYRGTYPEVVRAVRASRHFLIRSLRHLAGEEGVRQFLDIGAGLPTVENTHEVVQRVDPQSRVIYVDNDPVVLDRAEEYRRTGSREGATDCVEGDLRDPAAVLRAASWTLDLNRPVGLVLSGVLGHLGDDEARDAVRQLLAGLPPGSFLTVNDGTAGPPGGAHERAQEEYNASGALPYRLRTPAQIAQFLDGLEPVPPGVVTVSQWQPEISPFGDGVPVDAYGGVGRKSVGVAVPAPRPSSSPR